MTLQRRFMRAALTAALLTLLGLMLLATFPSSRTSAHFKRCDSVDGRSIRWKGSTVFATDRDNAIGQWRALGGVTIAPETPWDTATIEFRDVTRPDKSWAGQHSCRWARIDKLSFNRFFMDGYSTASRRHVALHELGHALGLDHSFSGQVMQSSTAFVSTLQSHDIADFCSKWGCPATGGGSGSGGGGGAREPQPTSPDQSQP